MIQFTIYLAASTVKEALKIRQGLLDGGVSENAISFPAAGASVMRSAAPSVHKTASLSQLETIWRELKPNEGKGFRCTDNMIAMFGLPSDREGQLRRMISLVENGEATKTATGWQPSNGAPTTNNGNGRDTSEDDTDEVLD